MPGCWNSIECKSFHFLFPTNSNLSYGWFLKDKYESLCQAVDKIPAVLMAECSSNDDVLLLLKNPVGSSTECLIALPRIRIALDVHNKEVHRDVAILIHKLMKIFWSSSLKPSVKKFWWMNGMVPGPTGLWYRLIVERYAYCRILYSFP